MTLQVMPYSTGCTTTLSNFEAGQNYKDVDDPAVTVSSGLEPGSDLKTHCQTAPKLCIHVRTLLMLCADLKLLMTAPEMLAC